MGAVVALASDPFRAEMRRLKGLKFAPTDLVTHWEALQDVPLDMLKAAIDRAQKECDEFPSPAVLRGFVDQERRRTPVEPDEDRSTPLAHPKQIVVPGAGTVIVVTRDWTYYCDVCSDQGARSFCCGPRQIVTQGESQVDRYPWLESRDCGNDRPHAGHEWSTTCACYDSNPAVQRRLERQRQAARRSEKE